MQNLPFNQPGRFWRGNLHAHSTNSDGYQTPEKVCALYEEAGYDFLALTDHFLDEYGFPLSDTRPYRSATFTTLLGAELHAGRTELGALWHILAVGLPLDFAPPAADETGPEIAARALATGAYVAIAHPNWYTLTEVDALSLGPVHAIEIYNGVAVDDNDRADSWHLLDVLLAQGKRYFACSNDDFHRHPRYHDFARGWIHVKAPALTPETLLAALKAGHYYSSTGPQIHDIQVDDELRIYVRTSPAQSIFVTGALSTGRRLHAQGVTEAEFDLRGFGSPYCRVTVRDAAGARAWSNPIWLNEAADG